jgi:phosphatidylglycerol lysyltransferase
VSRRGPFRRFASWLRNNGSSLLVFCLFLAGLIVMYRTLQEVDIHQVRAELYSLSWLQMGLAAVCTLGGYMALVGYDWSALRYIGRHLPFPLVVFTSFVGYALSNTIGVSWLSGGAVRYRIYSRAGLSGTEVALVAAFCTLGFVIGVALIGGGALVFQPYLLAAYFDWPPEAVRWGAAVLLGAFLIALVLRSRRSRVLRWRGRQFRLPATSVLAGQTGFSLLDISLAGATLYVVLPPSDLGFASFLIIYAIALMIGVLSQVPGGIGVFEAVILNALASFMPLEQVAAGLLAYRIVYYLVPFMIGILLLAAAEMIALGRLRRDEVPEALGDAWKTLSAVLGTAAPYAASGLTFLAGSLLLLGSSVPLSIDTLDSLERFFPVEVVELSHWFGGVLGTMLVVSSYALWKRIGAAVWLAAGLLMIGAVLSYIQTLDINRALVMAVGPALLLVTRRRFYRRSRLFSELQDFRWTLLSAAAMMCFLSLLLFSFKNTPYEHELWWQFAVTDQAPRGMRTAVVAATTFVLTYLFVAIRAPHYRPRPPSHEELEKARVIIAAQDNPDANFALMGDKALLFSENGQAFVMFGVHGSSWVSMGGPVGSDEQDRVDLIWEFKAQAARNQGQAVFYQVGDPALHHYIDANFTLVKLGEEARVPLAEFDLQGSHRARLRQARNRANREGLSFELVQPPHTDSLLEELETISDEWLAEKNVREKGFSVGFFDRDYLNHFPLALIYENGDLSAFANILATGTHRTATIDLMRHRNTADNSTMEFLFIELMLSLKVHGYEWFSLGMAPLSGLTDRASAPLWDRFGLLVYNKGSRFYNFEGLRRFKEKFDPVWEPRYMATSKRGISPLLVLTDIGALTSGGLSGMFRS